MGDVHGLCPWPSLNALGSARSVCRGAVGIKRLRALPGRFDVRLAPKGHGKGLTALLDAPRRF